MFLPWEPGSFFFFFSLNFLSFLLMEFFDQDFHSFFFFFPLRFSDKPPFFR